jgi:gliding motility-associated-like protein
MKFLLRFLLFFVLAHQAYATHYRAGEIRFENIRDANGVSTLSYHIIVTTYTRFVGISADADRCELILRVGGLNSNDTAILTRINGPQAPLGSGACAGKAIGVVLFGNTEYKENVYKTSVPKTFANNGVYKLFITDRNRVTGVANIPNSVDEPFTLESELDLTTGFKNNSSPVFTNYPLDKACVNKCFYHNPGAVDPDGDSLAYFIDTCRGLNLNIIPGYTLPNIISILPDGTFTWCTPTVVSVYNFAIRIEEYRKWNGKYVRIGYVIRDFQVDVFPCSNNPPDILASDTCVLAGALVIKKVRGLDQENNLIDMTASGLPFSFSPKATFTNTISTPGVANSIFSWQTTCSQIKKQPYNIVVRAQDNSSPTSLVKYQSFNVTVIAPPIKNLALQPLGSKVKLTWNKPDCAIPKTTFNSNGIVGYSIYRKLGCDTFKFDPCLGANNPISNYQLIGNTLSIDSLNFIDDNNGNGLSFESSYSYFVVPNYFDGSQSKISKQVCIRLSRNVPGIINVDVVKTDVTNGEIFLRWLKPLIGSGYLDTLVYGGPYKFDLRRFDVSNASDNGTIITSITKPFFKTISNLADTTYKDVGLNTKDKQYKYQIDFFATPAKSLIGNSNKASSVFLKLRGNNKKLILTWEETVPWVNYMYYVYQRNTANAFVLVDSTLKSTDTIFNLVNGTNYCFKIITKGRFLDEFITYDPLIDSSQIACDFPIDLNAPCLLIPSLLADCESSSLSIAYQFNKTDLCDTNDVLKLKLWRAFTDTSKFYVVDSIFNLSQGQFLYKNFESLAGCYAVTAVDSSNNESELSNKVCIDNCDFKFELPNIFTPNGDTANDLYTPVRKEVKFVNKLDFKIYDRWGLVVFETNEILINWNGNFKKTNQKCSDGVYFYVGSATIGRLKGDEIKKFTGYIHLQRGQ